VGQGSETTLGGEATLGPDGDATLAGDAGASRTLVVPRAPAVGDVIGRYVVLDTIGRGGMGVVLAAYDPQLDRKVALKLVRPDRAADRGEIEREARMIAKLRHPNLVTVHDVGTTEAGVFLAMEFIDGVTLHEWQRSDRTWRALVDVYVQAARGLAAAHEVGVVHGDFKPDNVFVGALGGKLDVKLLDFGLAHAAGHEPQIPSGAATSWIPAGTLAYMSPERIHGAAATPAGDQFAFCVALFEALTGGRPYQLETLASSSPPATKATPVWRPQVETPTWLRQLAQRGLALTPEARWSSMAELVHELERGPRRARRRVLALGGTAILSGALVLVATRPDPCADADAEVRAAWTTDLATHMAAADVDEVDDEMIARVDHRAQAYVAELSAAARRSCTTTRNGETLLEARRTRCIDMGLTTLRVWGEALGGDDQDMRRAALVDAVGWEAPISCDDDAALLHEPDLPPDLDREKTREMMARLQRSTLSRYSARFVAIEAELDALLIDLRELGDPALLAEALYRRGHLATRGGMPEQGYGFSLDALSSAEAGGATRLQVQIWRSIAENRNTVSGGEGLQALAIERATAATARLGDPPDLVSAVHLLRASLAGRRGDPEGADAELDRAIEVADAADLGRAAVAARLFRTIVQLRADQVDLAVATGERVAADARRLYGAEHPETAIALGAHAAALSAAGRFDEARVRVDGSLAILDAWGRLGVTSANGVACNWCSGVARVCRHDDTLTACSACIERVLRSDTPTMSSLSALGIGLNWLRVLAPDAAIGPARRVIASADRSEKWWRVRATAALAVLAKDPASALAEARELCPSPDAQSCYQGVNMIVATHDSDARRRAEAMEAAVENWRADTIAAQSEGLGVGLELARGDHITRDELARAAAEATTPCDPERDAALAWIAASDASGTAAGSK